jgi:hypothetical protein
MGFGAAGAFFPPLNKIRATTPMKIRNIKLPNRPRTLPPTINAFFCVLFA